MEGKLLSLMQTRHQRALWPLCIAATALHNSLVFCANILALAWKDCSAAGVSLRHPIARSLSPLYGSTNPSTIPSIRYHCRTLTHLIARCSHHDMLARLRRRGQRRAEWHCASVCSVIAATNSRRGRSGSPVLTAVLDVDIEGRSVCLLD